MANATEPDDDLLNTFQADASAEALGALVAHAVLWSPVWPGDDPLTGFRTGHDSVLFGSTPTVAMPQDERTAALLLLVTSTFVHLSASRGDPVPLIRGAVDVGIGAYRFVTLDRAVNRAHVRAIRESRRASVPD